MARGPNDIVARLLAQKLGEIDGQSFIVENKPGGGSNIGAEFVARAPADGYTLLVAATSHAINMTLFSKEQLKYNLLTDLTPVSMIMTGPLVLVTRPDFAPNNVKELVAAAKAKPGELSFASSGNGSSTHLGGEMFASVAGIKTIHVPYQGSGPALTDVMGGQASYMLDIVLRVADQAAESLHDLRHALADRVGQAVAVALLRGGAPTELQVVVAPWPERAHRC